MPVLPFGLEPDVLVALVAGAALIWVAIRVRGPGARQVVVGTGVVLAGVAVGEWAGLFPNDRTVARWWPEAVLAIVIVLQPEIRKGLGAIGRLSVRRPGEPEARLAVEEVVKAAIALASRRIGALIVIERRQELLDAVEVGTVVDARLSKDLLISLFLPYSPLHDGAAILRGTRIAAAGCFLPLSAGTPGGEASGVGTRHRAAIGITEDSDALAIVVSEESGGISLVSGGEIERDLGADELRRRLTASLGSETPPHARRAWLSRARSS